MSNFRRFSPGVSLSFPLKSNEIVLCLSSACGLLLSARAYAQSSLVVNVVGTTSTQEVLQYNAPTTSACTIAASESTSLPPLSRDVDPALFPQSNQDSRSGNLISGQRRVVVLG